jgi:hypothetical protein
LSSHNKNSFMVVIVGCLHITADRVLQIRHVLLSAHKRSLIKKMKGKLQGDYKYVVSSQEVSHGFEAVAFINTK